MRWIVLVRLRKSGSLLAYEYEQEHEAHTFFATASENSDAHLRLFRASLIDERKAA